MRSLIDAALDDQERRVLAATPAEVADRAPGVSKRNGKGKRQVQCRLRERRHASERQPGLPVHVHALPPDAQERLMAVKQRINSADPETRKKFRRNVDRFIWHYVWGTPGVAGVGYKAVLAAGWSESHARSQASVLLANPKIKARIATEMTELEQDLKTKAGLVLEREYLRAMGENVPGNEQAAALFLRAFGKLVDKVELSGAVTWEQLVPKRKPPTEGEH